MGGRTRRSSGEMLTMDCIADIMVTTLPSPFGSPKWPKTAASGHFESRTPGLIETHEQLSIFLAVTRGNDNTRRRLSTLTSQFCPVLTTPNWH